MCLSSETVTFQNPAVDVIIDDRLTATGSADRTAAGAESYQSPAHRPTAPARRDDPTTVAGAITRAITSFQR
jgi:hypothetical protein